MLRSYCCHTYVAFDIKNENNKTLLLKLFNICSYTYNIYFIRTYLTAIPCMNVIFSKYI